MFGSLLARGTGLATKWVSTIECKWCRESARVGIEKDGQGQTYRVMCKTCGINEQAGMTFPAGEQITRDLEKRLGNFWEPVLNRPRPLVIRPKPH